VDGAVHGAVASRTPMILSTVCRRRRLGRLRNIAWATVKAVRRSGRTTPGRSWWRSRYETTAERRW
jgi:hypothetical protein